jgi:hypothetical protein
VEQIVLTDLLHSHWQVDEETGLTGAFGLGEDMLQVRTPGMMDAVYTVLSVVCLLPLSTLVACVPLRDA